MALVAGLPAPLWLLWSTGFPVLVFLLRAHDIARGWLGGVSRMLLGLRQLRLEGSYAGFQLRASRASR